MPVCITDAFFRAYYKQNNQHEGKRKMNRLKDESSPYLLQHADNPVDWYPWGDAAFARAKAENKPIFLSIGYSTCHWCHVMAEESFADPEIAKILNRDFISVKVDREERPDIDSIYMTVCQAMTGSGGWPMSIFMTPEKKPFFAGTYFPRHATMGMVGFDELIGKIGVAWKRKQGEMEHAAEEILRELRQMKQETVIDKGFSETTLRETLMHLEAEAMTQLQDCFDPTYGGFGTAPKFPMAPTLLFLLQRWEETQDETALAMAERTLLQMYKGGIYDHIGGGFCRYSTDQYFFAPHFEKMLYDNALLIAAYSMAYRLTGKGFYLRVAEETADWAFREMCSGKGGFFAAQDAGGKGEEGKFYTFDEEELLALLGKTDGKAFCSRYGCREKGNFEGKNILHLLAHAQPDEADKKLREQVYQYRKQRYKLATDDKQLTAWNGLMAAGLAELYRATGEKKYLHGAKSCIRFFWMLAAGDDGRLILPVSYRNGEAKGRGLLTDYGAMLFALLQVYAACGEEDWLKQALRLQEAATDNFYDDEKGGFTLWGKYHEALLFNQKEIDDSPLPSGNALMAWSLHRLAVYCENEALRQEAAKQFAYMAGRLQATGYPAGSSFFLMAAGEYLHPEKFYSCQNGVCAPLRGKQWGKSDCRKETES